MCHVAQGSRGRQHVLPLAVFGQCVRGFLDDVESVLRRRRQCAGYTWYILYPLCYTSLPLVPAILAIYYTGYAVLASPLFPQSNTNILDKTFFFNLRKKFFFCRQLPRQFRLRRRRNLRPEAVAGSGGQADARMRQGEAGRRNPRGPL
jgi:hypothetical protein